MNYIQLEHSEANKAEWLLQRKNYITGTDAACLLGISPWGSKFSVWLDKTGQGEPTVENESMKWGKKLESEILKNYAETMNCELIHVDGYDLKVSKLYPKLACSLDGWNNTDKIPVDAKNIRYISDKWGEQFSDIFPEYYKTQLQVQMMVTGAKVAHLAVLFSGQEFRIYCMEYNENLAQQILKATDKFWELVASGEMPEASSDEATTNFIRTKYSSDSGTEKEATDEIISAVKSLKEAKNSEKEIKALIDKYSNQIKLFMGDASVIPNYCTWKNNKASEKTDWETIARELLAALPISEQQKLCQAHTQITNGARILRITMKG